MNWAIGLKVGKASYKSVLIALSNYHHAKNNNCTPSIATLVSFTELNWKTVTAAINWLEEAGFIAAIKRPGTSTNYLLNTELTASKIGVAKRAGNTSNLVIQAASKNGGASKIGTASKNDIDRLQKRPEPPPNLEDKQVNRNNKETNVSCERKKKLPNPKNEKYLKAARAMWEKIQPVTGDDKSPDFELWANDIRLLVETDNKSPEEVWRVFTWANQDEEFWRANIRCPSKLRKQFGALCAKIKQENYREENKREPGSSFNSGRIPAGDKTRLARQAQFEREQRAASIIEPDLGCVGASG